MFDVIVEALFSVRFHSFKKHFRKNISKNNNLYGGYIKGLGKETGEFSHQVFCAKLDISQKQMDSMLFYITKAKKIDKNNTILIFQSLSS